MYIFNIYANMQVYTPTQTLKSRCVRVLESNQTACFSPLDGHIIGKIDFLWKCEVGQGGGDFEESWQTEQMLMNQLSRQADILMHRI